MTRQEEMIAALRASQGESSLLVDLRKGNSWRLGLQRTLGSAVKDQTEYRRGRVYCLDCQAEPAGGVQWRTHLRVLISSVGPYVTQTFRQVHNGDQWWAGAIRAQRNGSEPQHADLLAKVRAWYEANNLVEVDTLTLGQTVPDDLQRLGDRRQVATLFQALFGR